MGKIFKIGGLEIATTYNLNDDSLLLADGTGVEFKNIHGANNKNRKVRNKQKIKIV